MPAKRPPRGYDRKSIWRSLRRQVAIRQGWRCLWCGKPITGKHGFRVDHIQTVKARPDLYYEPTNLRGLCAACDAKRHREKGDASRNPDRLPIGLDGYPIDKPS
jgi:5-methylcytosine-specific restriction endonuclease McrA